MGAHCACMGSLIGMSAAAELWFWITFGAGLTGPPARRRLSRPEGPAHPLPRPGHGARPRPRLRRDAHHRQRRRLEQWIEDVKADGIGPMTTYATGVTSDFYAVHAGILLARNSGVIEGRVTDLKLIKRQIGRCAGILLLRKRVILVANSRRTSTTTDTTVEDDIWTITAHQNLG